MRWRHGSWMISSALCLAEAVYVVTGPISAQDVRQESMLTAVYGAADWYLSRPEEEQRWHGRLEKQDAPTNPSGRTSLTYVFITDNHRLPVYAARVEALLNRFAGQPVFVHGKIVDLTHEGLGQELWIGAIAIVSAESR
jgi:hypothetical protein